jgi:predicted dithiol-disulfide oxidoreductase (DUF899 family)
VGRRARGRACHRFTAPAGGDATLLDVFDGSRQLVVYRFFMDPDTRSDVVAGQSRLL